MKVSETRCDCCNKVVGEDTSQFHVSMTDSEGLLKTLHHLEDVCPECMEELISKVDDVVNDTTVSNKRHTLTALLNGDSR